MIRNACTAIPSVISAYPAVAMFSDIVVWIYVILGVAAVALIVLLIVALSGKSTGLGPQTDTLTGMGSKRYLEACFARANAIYRQHCCIAYVSYKSADFATRYGKENLEKLEKHTANMIMSVCSDYDYSARVSTGVFVIMYRLQDKSSAKLKLNTLIDELNSFEKELVGENFHPFRVGLYTLESENETFDSAFANAKLGYLYAEENLVNFYICTKELLLTEASRTRLKNKLNIALDMKQFDLFLQFVYDVKSNSFCGAEALSRWCHPDDGILLPAYYIADMRTTGVIVRFDFYMLEKACKLLEEWGKSADFKKLYLSVNFTRMTISTADFVDRFKAIVKKYSFDYSKLTLEITEDALEDNHALAFSNIVECKKAGFKVAIDDFGAGHTSINDLYDYPIDTIKVDRDIIVKASTVKGNALLHGLIEFAHKLGLQVVCEGVETEQQKNAVMKNETDFIQGYLYSYVFSVDEAKRHYLESLNK